MTKTRLVTAALATLLTVAPALAERVRLEPTSVRSDIEFKEDGSLVVEGQFYGNAFEFQDSEQFKSGAHRCATPQTLRGGTKAAADCTMVSTTINSQYAPANGGVYTIPVVFHIIRKTDGTGEVSDALIQSQLAVLNEDFRALAGSLGANGNDTKVQFVMATTTPTGAATNGINRYTNNTWFADPGPGVTNAMKQSIRWDTTRYFNIYTNDAAGNLGYATFPQEDAGTYQDGVVLLWSSVGRNAPGGGIYNLGRTATHEVGHYLGLFHTFQGGCGTTSGYTTGDLVADTERQASSVFNCPTGATSCSGQRNPIENYMNYTQDSCMYRFTIEQANRLRCSLTSYRGTLYTTSGGGTNTPPTANFNFTTNQLVANFTDASTDANGTVTGWSWNFGDGGTSTVQNPSRTYASAGTRTVSLTVTDNGGATGSTSKSVTVSTTTTVTVLTKAVAVTNQSGGVKQYSLVVPAGSTNLTFTMSGGTGDADMHVKFGSMPTTTTYDCRPYKSGNAETCTFAAPSAGTYYVMLNPYSAFTGVSLVGNYTVASTCTAVTEVEPNNSMSTTASQLLSATCNQVSGNFTNDASSNQNDYYRISLPAGRTVTALLNGLSVDYDAYIYRTGSSTAVASGTAGGTTAENISWTNNTGATTVVYVRVYRYSSTKSTYQLRVSY